MGLDQDRYLVAASVQWHGYASRRRAVVRFDGTGIDDRDDHLVWFADGAAAPGSRIDITVVNAAAAHSPRRAPRRNASWLRARIRAGAARDRRLMARLAARLGSL